MKDTNIANFLLNIPRITQIPVDTLTMRRYPGAVMLGGMFAVGFFGILVIFSVFVAPLSWVAIVLIPFTAFMSVMAVITADAYRSATLYTLKLCTGYKMEHLPEKSKILRAALRIPFKTQRIPLIEFETDLQSVRYKGKFGQIASPYRSKEVGTHHIQMSLVLQPGKVWVEQAATLTSFGIMAKDMTPKTLSFKEQD